MCLGDLSLLYVIVNKLLKMVNKQLKNQNKLTPPKYFLPLPIWVQNAYLQSYSHLNLQTFYKLFHAQLVNLFEHFLQLSNKLFRVSSCGATVSENCTYIQNPGFSTAYTTSGSCAYTVSPINTNICQLRLDFDKFEITIGTAGTCTDSFVAKGPTNSNGLENVCGKLTGQHSKYNLSFALCNLFTKLTCHCGA